MLDLALLSVSGLDMPVLVAGMIVGVVVGVGALLINRAIETISPAVERFIGGLSR